MKYFYMTSDNDSSNTRVIHERDCQLIPSIYDRNYLGPFNTAHEALRRASQKHENLSICPECGNYTEIYSFVSRRRVEKVCESNSF
jgi:hypothetical protein